MKIEVGDVERIYVDTHQFLLTVLDVGRRVEFRTPRGGKRAATVDRHWRVEWEGRVIGFVGYQMFTRERKAKGVRYVLARWDSPGWGWSTTELGSHWEAYPSTRADCLRRLLVEAHRMT